MTEQPDCLTANPNLCASLLRSPIYLLTHPHWWTIKEEEEEIALVIADQGIPEMTGRDFLGRVRSIVPTASNHAAALLLAARSTGISC
jgi:hypothetical protein